MRVVREAEFKTCSECGCRRRTRAEALGCDCCGKVLDFEDQDVTHLNISIHRNDREEVEHRCYCSWKCFFKDAPGIETDYFISLPLLHYDEAGPGCMAQDFWEAAREFGGEKAQ